MEINNETNGFNGEETTSSSYFDSTSGTAPDSNRNEAPIPPPTWNYGEQNKFDKKESKKSGKSGALVFAGVMAGIFSGALVFLALAIVFGGSLYKTEKVVYKENVVYVREDGTVTGKLSVGEVYNKVLPSTVEVKVTRTNSSGTGTGIVMSEDGYIITNAHVVENSTSISVKTHDENVFKANLIGLDTLADVAVIKIEPGSYKLAPATFGKSSDLLVGDVVVAIGCPAGHFLTATEGIVSAPIKMVEMHDESGRVEKEMLVLQTSAELNPGNSGGPLINLSGEVIGINSMKLTVASDGTPYEGLGYAIPMDEAMILVERLKAGEKTMGEGIAVKAMRLGITGGMCEKGADDGMGGKFAESGVYITEVQKGSNADKKLFPGDIILTYNGNRIEVFENFSEYVKKLKNNDVLKLTVYRDGKTVDVEITMDIMK